MCAADRAVTTADPATQIPMSRRRLYGAEAIRQDSTPQAPLRMHRETTTDEDIREPGGRSAWCSTGTAPGVVR